MPLKSVSPKEAQRLLAAFIGEEIDMIPVSKRDGSEGYMPATASLTLRESMRDALSAQDMILQLHIDNAVLVTFPQRKAGGALHEKEDPLSVHAYVVRCRDGKFRISHAANEEPPYKEKTAPLAQDFNAGSARAVTVKKPLRVKPRPKPPL